MGQKSCISDPWLFAHMKMVANEDASWTLVVNHSIVQIFGVSKLTKCISTAHSNSQ